MFTGNKILLLSVVLLSLFSCQTKTVPDFRTPPSPLPNAGINWGYPRKERERFDLFKEMGIVWLRVDFSWNKLEPAPGEWNFEDTDYFCKEALSRGHKIIGVLGFDTPWLHGDPKGKRQIDPEDLESYLRYVERVVSRYGDLVDEWEIWNEPNLPFHTFWTGSEGDYFALTRAAVERIHRVKGDARVAVGAVWRYDPGFIRRMAASGALDGADLFSYHPYYDRPDKILRESVKLQNKLRASGFTGDFRITEVGFNTYGHLPTSCSPEEQGRLLWETLLNLGRLNHPYFIWYTLSNPYSSEYKGLWDDQYGVLLEKGGEFIYKTGGWALRYYNTLLAGKSPVPVSLAGKKSLLSRLRIAGYENPDKSETALILMGKGRTLDLTLTGLPRGRVYNGATGETADFQGNYSLTLKRNEPLIFIASDFTGVRIDE